MKKLFALVIIVFCSFSFGFGQTNIYGGNFEHWKKILNHRYFEPDSSIFWTLNQLDTVPSIGGMITTAPCDTAYSGNYSVRVKTQWMELLHIVIPGVIGTLQIDWAGQKAILGIPYPYGDSLPQVFSGYYQSYPVSTDSTAAVILLSKWNTVTHKRDTLGYNYMAFHDSITSWTLFEMPIIYRDPNTHPDSLTILLLSCGGFNAHNMFASHGQVGTKAMFDDVKFTGFYGVGLPRVSKPSEIVKLSPNPTSGLLKIELGNEVNDGYFEIYNGQGKLLSRYRVNGKGGQINVSNLPDGMYHYKLTNNNISLSSGTFIVIK